MKLQWILVDWVEWKSYFYSWHFNDIQFSVHPIDKYLLKIQFSTILFYFYQCTCCGFFYSNVDLYRPPYGSGSRGYKSCLKVKTNFHTKLNLEIYDLFYSFYNICFMKSIFSFWFLFFKFSKKIWPVFGDFFTSWIRINITDFFAMQHTFTNNCTFYVLTFVHATSRTFFRLDYLIRVNPSWLDLNGIFFPRCFSPQYRIIMFIRS